ncbi:DEAD/DEAH box helicase, partial [candidate division GN15 bacterium]|nr:DEAD/DEAH box helicase [candidate division GN15 bacterium]
MEIRVSDLGRYGIPESVLDRWRDRQGELLLPVQSRAVRQGLLHESDGSSRQNVLISAPTSAGKSFCGEMAAVKALTARQKVIMLYPLKSLAEQQFQRWQETYGNLGISALIVTGDHPENDRAFRRGDYHLAVAIYEKLDLALTRRLDLLQTVGLVVVDEIQMIAEKGRGAVLERLLTMIRANSYQLRIVALTGAVGEADLTSLTEWLDARLVEETVRPRDLIRGVAAGDELRYRSFNGRLDGFEKLPQTVPDAVEDAGGESLVSWILTELDRSGYPALVFVRSRSSAIELALGLAARSPWPEARQALALLANEEPSALQRTLRQVLAHGVAFHSADLSASERSAVEKSFISGEIKILCSTTTLAMGVDLPAETVLLETVKYASGEYSNRAELVPITRIEYENMTGRAGRYRDDAEAGAGPGRAIVLAGSTFDQEVLWQRYVCPPQRNEIRSAFDSQSLEDWLLAFAVSGLARRVGDLMSLLKRTYCWQCQPDRQADVVASLNRLTEEGMIEPTAVDRPESDVAVTALGTVAAQSGLGVAATRDYCRELNAGYPEGEFGWLCLALNTASIQLPPGILSGFELRQNLPVRMLYQRFDHSVEEAAALLPEDHRRRRLDYRTSVALKAALVLDDWRRSRPLAEIEERYRIHAGQIQA